MGSPRSYLQQLWNPPLTSRPCWAGYSPHVLRKRCPPLLVKITAICHLGWSLMQQTWGVSVGENTDSGGYEHKHGNPKDLFLEESTHFEWLTLVISMATNHQSLGSFSKNACGGAAGRASSVAGAGSSACDGRKSPVASWETAFVRCEKWDLCQFTMIHQPGIFCFFKGHSGVLIFERHGTWFCGRLEISQCNYSVWPLINSLVTCKSWK